MQQRLHLSAGLEMPQCTPEELEEVAEERKVRASLLRLLSKEFFSKILSKYL